MSYDPKRGFDPMYDGSREEPPYPTDSDHAAAVARLKEAGDGLENELNDLRAAAVLHGGILLRNRIDEALAAWGYPIHRDEPSAPEWSVPSPPTKAEREQERKESDLARLRRELEDKSARIAALEKCVEAADRMREFMSHTTECLFSSKPCFCGHDEIIAAYDAAKKGGVG